jgi:large subunit ribosomal protein L9
MQVVLLERVEKLGQMGEIVRVKDGYARNFLLPRKKALRATKENMVRFEAQRAQLEARNLELRGEAEKVQDKLNGQSFVVLRQAGETGQLYGSVTTRDIADAVTAGGFSSNRNQVALNHPIKTIGLHEVRVVLHPEVFSMVTINVARSEEEAARQAAGEDLTRRGREAEEDEVEAAAFFESEELVPAEEGEAGEAEEGQAEADAE